jgi:site-specific DNA recombinase
MRKNGNGIKNSGNSKPPEKRTTRCAIYTRKSTDEGLDSDFNSLDAQRESAEAYIKSQAGEGWVALPEHYDDGGFTGGNMERPALYRLLEDVQNDKVDCVVVYKVDRLSRSLIDFSRIIDVLDKHEVSFVSVTQQFNTSNSIGRLTLNILLSFAQFEREIIAERTRDKMCAARKKGKWIGGYPMLGYDIAPKGGKLIINPEEAGRVREILWLYLQHQSLTRLAQELNTRGWTTKSWIKKNGKRRLGKPFTKTHLHSLLTNMVYLGKIEHQGEVYEGEHEAILDEALWTKVQQVLESNPQTKGNKQRNRHGALLRGAVVCGSCQKPMYHSYTKKGGNKLYRYYICETAQKLGYSQCPTKSVSAPAIENFVLEKIKNIGKSPTVLEETTKNLMAQLTASQKSLDDEGTYLRKEIADLKQQIKHLGSNGADSQASPLDERLKLCEKRLSEINRRKILLANATIKKADIKKALSLFEPIWDVLYPNEQARILSLLIEKVIYNGEQGTIAINFRPLGIKTLADEAGAKPKNNETP